jgi:lactoylglutathione lyase
MKLEHVALWSGDIERLCAFYQMYFGAQANTKYLNEEKQFESYFLTFSSGARLEIMQRPDIHSVGRERADEEFFGYAHVAFSAGSERAVDELTTRLAADGFEHLDGPRRTGDGYYESVILDPDGNRIEITV